MTRFVEVNDFEEWRSVARGLLETRCAPHEVYWNDPSRQQMLFEAEDSARPRKGEPRVRESLPFRVPQAFLDLARQVACHRDSQRWEILYRTLWRITHGGERELLEIATDDDVLRLREMRKSVTRDVHKMKAFVRFRRIEQAERETFVAWHRPDHRIVRLAAPFFARRFKGMDWSIVTPDESVSWDQRRLHFGPGVPISEAPDGDALEELWQTYYRSIFNPARVKTRTMKREMPVRYWPTMPETEVIPELLLSADSRVAEMIASREGFADTAARHLPDASDLESLAAAAAACTACDLHRHASQTVFGEGPARASLMLVGEQPGDAEDLEGRPFVGPAGSLLNDMLRQSGIERRGVYVTNVVKHFKFTPRGKRRLHQKPDAREIFACRPWFEAELFAVRPRVVVALGATAAQALLGRDFRVTRRRGEVVASEWCGQTMATWHPAPILRMPDPQRRQEMEGQLLADLRSIRPLLLGDPS